MDTTIEDEQARAASRRVRGTWKDQFLGVLLTTMSVAYVGHALLVQDVVGVIQALGMTGLGVHLLRRPLPLEVNIRDAFRASAEQPFTVEEALSSAVAVTLVAAGALGRFLEWLWY